MGLDINFYKKDIVEIDEYFSTRDRELFDYITTKCGVVYGNEQYGKQVKLTKKQVEKIINYMGKHNQYGGYSHMIAELTTLKEEKKEIYMSADW